MRKFLKSLFCIHEYQFERNIFGDEINKISTKKIYRSEWRCQKCEKLKYKEKLYLIVITSGDVEAK
jgi:hypothetical protein